jgi:hypothetical protein
MSWPLSQDYNEAIQSPTTSFSDPELQQGEVVCNDLGIPMPRSGNFADVYEVRCPNGTRWAVKCFTRQVKGLRERYQEISLALQEARLPFTVEFTYQQEGIRVRGPWYPILKMQWVEGLTFNEFVRQNLDKPGMLDGLSQIWTRMAQRLRGSGIAHADLQHGNVLLVPGSTANAVAVKLIDYDGMFVPALAGKTSGEVGHPSYQHPQRVREGIYNPDVDRVPLLLISAALRCVRVGGRDLWDRYDNGDNLLFNEADLMTPADSPLFRELGGWATTRPERWLAMCARPWQDLSTACPCWTNCPSSTQRPWQHRRKWYVRFRQRWNRCSPPSHRLGLRHLPPSSPGLPSGRRLLSQPLSSPSMSTRPLSSPSSPSSRQPGYGGRAASKRSHSGSGVRSLLVSAPWSPSPVGA